MKPRNCKRLLASLRRDTVRDGIEDEARSVYFDLSGSLVTERVREPSAGKASACAVISENGGINGLFGSIEIPSRLCRGHATSGDNDEAASVTGPRRPPTRSRMAARQGDCHPEEATQSADILVSSR